jgi:hypothetical protein
VPGRRRHQRQTVRHQGNPDGRLKRCESCRGARRRSLTRSPRPLRKTHRTVEPLMSASTSFRLDPVGPTSLAPPLAPGGLSACHGVHRPPVPRAGQTARPGNRKGQTMTEAAVSFAGNLTDDPELRHTDGGIARATFGVAVSGQAGADSVVLHRHRVARPGRACRPVPGQGQPGRGRGPTPAAGLDRRGRQRPIHRRGAGRGAGAEPAVSDGDRDQNQEPGSVARWTIDETSEARWGGCYCPPPTATCFSPLVSPLSVEATRNSLVAGDRPAGHLSAQPSPLLGEASSPRSRLGSPPAPVVTRRQGEACMTAGEQDRVGVPGQSDHGGTR